ncbi:MAG: hypothetical protein JNL70_23800 [Saprospiraceae bacterium]|nr:hypothetical protein [Saprospiraceae bacterium]
MKLFFKSVIVLLLLIAVVLGYVREVPYFSNTFDILYLFFRFLFVGVLVGICLGWFVSRKMQDASDRMPVFLLCLVPCMAVFPLLGILSNHILVAKDPLSIKVIFEKEEPLMTSRFGVRKNSIIQADAYYVYFTRNYKQDRVRCKNQSFRSIEKGQEIELPIKKGFWGFDFVEIK